MLDLATCPFELHSATNLAKRLGITPRIILLVIRNYEYTGSTPAERRTIVRPSAFGGIQSNLRRCVVLVAVELTVADANHATSPTGH